jgi:hypothetical protein
MNHDPLSPIGLHLENVKEALEVRMNAMTAR